MRHLFVDREKSRPFCDCSRVVYASRRHPGNAFVGWVCSPCCLVSACPARLRSKIISLWRDLQKQNTTKSSCQLNVHRRMVQCILGTCREHGYMEHHCSVRCSKWGFISCLATPSGLDVVGELLLTETNASNQRVRPSVAKRINVLLLDCIKREKVERYPRHKRRIPQRHCYVLSTMHHHMNLTEQLHLHLLPIINDQIIFDEGKGSLVVQERTMTSAID